MSLPAGSRQALHIDPIDISDVSLSPSDAGPLASMRSVDSFEIGSGASVSFREGATMEAPNFGQYQMILASLLLTTIMAMGSALDAKNECIDQEMYSWLLDFFDDDTGNGAENSKYYDYDDYYNDFVGQEGRAECLYMFRHVVIPAGATTLVFGLLSIYIIHRHATYVETISDNFDPCHMSALLRLLVPLLVVLLSWTYAIFSIMLNPKVNPSLYQQNPFKSLAAVDEMGHIGDNANLYYLSWICQTQIMVMVYLVMVECIRRFGRRTKQPESIEHATSFSDHITMHEHIQTMLSYTSAKRLAALYKRRRKKWYRFILHLRKRSGFWVAAFFSSIVLFASSAYVFVQVLVSLASSVQGSNDFQYRDVCTIIKGTEGLPEQFCIRSAFAVIAGGVSAGLCVIAMIMHILVRRRSAYDEDTQNSCSVMATQVLPGAMDPETTRFHLGIEFLLSFCISVLLGVNACVATGVQGPAATVGNLYYASWLSFLLCLRICLGCLEELYHVHASQSDSKIETNVAGNVPQMASHGSSIGGSEMSIDMHNYRRMVKKERSSHLHKYCFLFIFSTVCFASAWDAAYNQEAECSREQKYVIFAPAGVAVISMIMFLLCLKPRSYAIVSHICFGGLMSVVCFVVWLIDLIISMHSEDSWAVNSIGEMKLANLYYFSWAAILTAALQMIAYLKPLLGNKSKDAMFLVWAGIVKVCMVILGASSHVWYNIRDTCNNNDSEGGESTFCSRTRFAQIVAVTGVVSGWSVMGSRILGCSISKRTRNRAEAVLSSVLVILFGVAVALITSIGGPGESVGDLYYSTWLSFWVSIGIFVSCFDQMKQEELESNLERCQNEEADTRYVHFDAMDTPKE